MEDTMYLKKVAIISRSSSDFPELQKDLKKTGIDIYTVSSVQEIIGRYMDSQFVLAIINEDSYGEQTPKAALHPGAVI